MAIDNLSQLTNTGSSRTLGEVSESRNNWTDYAPEYNAAFKTALLIQAVLAVVTVILLDFGQAHCAFWVALLCQWAIVWIILFRRPIHPTRFDLSLVRYGIVPLLFIVADAGPWFLNVLGFKM
jgi:hypothetical protein